MQRYRECHDFYHAIVNMPVSVEYEVAVKAFEFANLGIPMTGLGAALSTCLQSPNWYVVWNALTGTRLLTYRFPSQP